MRVLKVSRKDAKIHKKICNIVILQALCEKKMGEMNAKGFDYR
jgi:hypothetical protein